MLDAVGGDADDGRELSRGSRTQRRPATRESACCCFHQREERDDPAPVADPDLLTSGTGVRRGWVRPRAATSASERDGSLSDNAAVDERGCRARLRDRDSPGGDKRGLGDGVPALTSTGAAPNALRPCAPVAQGAAPKQGVPQSCDCGECVEIPGCPRFLLVRQISHPMPGRWFRASTGAGPHTSRSAPGSCARRPRR